MPSSANGSEQTNVPQDHAVTQKLWTGFVMFDRTGDEQSDLRLASVDDNGLHLETPANTQFEVVGADVDEWNGLYEYVGLRDKVPHYRNPRTKISLLRYRDRQTANVRWFVSRLDLCGKDFQTDELRATVQYSSVETSSLNADLNGYVRFEDMTGVQAVEGWLHIIVKVFSGACVMKLILRPLESDLAQPLLVMRKGIIMTRQRRQQSSDASVNCTKPLSFLEDILHLDGMGPWLGSIGLESLMALSCTSCAMQNQKCLWRSIRAASAYSAVLLALIHGPSAPVQILEIKRTDSSKQPPLTPDQLTQILASCPSLQSLTVTGHPLTRSLLDAEGWKGTHSSSLVTLALGEFVGGRGVTAYSLSEKVWNLLAAPMLENLQSLALPTSAVLAALEVIPMVGNESLSPRTCISVKGARLLMLSLVNTFQGFSPSETSTFIRIPLSRCLTTFLRGERHEDFSADPELMAYTSWIVSVICSQQQEISAEELTGAFIPIVGHLENSIVIEKDCLSRSSDREVLKGENARLISHALLRLCQKAMMHRNSGLCEQLVQRSIELGVLPKLIRVARCNDLDVVIFQRALCLLDSFSYDAPEVWLRRDFQEVQGICCNVLSNVNLIDDEAIRLHAEALISRSSIQAITPPTLMTPALTQQGSDCWRVQLKPGDLVDAMDIQQSSWYEARVLKVDAIEGGGEVFRVLVHYMGWNPRWDEWIDLRTEAFRILKRNQVVMSWREKVVRTTKLDVKLPEGSVAKSMGYVVSDWNSRSLILPYGRDPCDINAGDLNQFRWNSGEVVEVIRQGDELFARVSISRSKTGVISSALGRNRAWEQCTILELLSNGYTLECWYDLNGDSVQQSGTHTGRLRQRHVWGALMKEPRTPHDCPEGGDARWSIGSYTACCSLSRRQSLLQWMPR